MGIILPEISYVYSEFLLQPKLQTKRPYAEDVDLSAPLAKFTYDENKPWNEQTQHRLNLGFMAAAMQSVCGDMLSVALAKEGGLGTIFCSQPIEAEAEMIKKVKRFRGGFVIPDVISPAMYVRDVISLTKKTGYGKHPVTENGRPDGKLVGLLTEDLYTNDHRNVRVAERMIKNGKRGWKYDGLKRYVMHERDVQGDLSKAHEFMKNVVRGRIALIVDGNYRLKSAVFRRDIEEHEKHKNTELVDGQKRYKVAAAVNTHDYKKRVPAVLDAGADYLVIDAAQGHTEWQAETLRWIRGTYGDDVVVISGNYVTPEGFDFAVRNGADAVKVGIGPGSICTTRMKFGGGAGQATAVKRITNRRNEYFKQTGIYVPVIPDGGVVNPSDVIIAWGLEGDIVMMGRYFAGYHESPTDVEYIEVESKDAGKFHVPVKPYWGEGSEKAKAWREKRYDQESVEEGVEGYVPYKGRLPDTFPIVLHELKIGVHKFGYTGVKNLNDCAQLMRQSEGSVHEGKPHDVYMK